MRVKITTVFPDRTAHVTFKDCYNSLANAVIEEERLAARTNSVFKAMTGMPFRGMIAAVEIVDDEIPDQQGDELDHDKTATSAGT